MFGQNIIVELDIQGSIGLANDYSHRYPEEEKQPKNVGLVRSFQSGRAYDSTGSQALSNDLYSKASRMTDEGVANFNDCLKALQDNNGDY